MSLSYREIAQQLQKKPPQKEVVKPAQRFKKTDRELIGGNSTPIVANKQAKNGKTKEFALKKFKKAESCAIEKLSYDLLQLCGVKVPKTYILNDERNEPTVLASRIEPGYKDLLFWVGGTLRGKEFTRYLEKENEIFKNQHIPTQNKKEKPIIGLFENVGVFAFLQDRDAVGGSLQNIGLVEHDEYFQAVKIDPGYCTLSHDDDDSSLKRYLDYLQKLSSGNRWYDLDYHGDRGGNAAVFNHATPEQVKDGMMRVAKLSDKQLRAVIYNPKISSLSKETRDGTYNTLIIRRNAYQKQLGVYSSFNPLRFFARIIAQVAESYCSHAPTWRSRYF